MARQLKLATYNIWNDPLTIAQRINYIIDVLNELEADFIALQEVPFNLDIDLCEQLLEKLRYKFITSMPYSDDASSGLVFLSRNHAITDSGSIKSEENQGIAQRCSVEIDTFQLNFVNVHLTSCPVPVHVRENEMVKIISSMPPSHKTGHYNILLGDINCDAESSVCRFLTGKQSLNGTGTFWHDLHRVSALKHTGDEPLNTLDFSSNARWSKEYTLELPARFDYIFLKDCYPDAYPRVKKVDLFGEHIISELNLHPSDHYGVVAAVEFSN